MKKLTLPTAILLGFLILGLSYYFVENKKLDRSEKLTKESENWQPSSFKPIEEKQNVQVLYDECVSQAEIEHASDWLLWQDMREEAIEEFRNSVEYKAAMEQVQRATSTEILIQASDLILNYEKQLNETYDSKQKEIDEEYQNELLRCATRFPMN